MKHEKLLLSADIETTSRHIACVGIAWSETEAICIPIMNSASLGTNYWSLDEEVLIIMKLRELLTHPAVEVVWQNGAYDLQHFAKHWGFLPHLSHDTMLMQHILFPGEPKALDFLASIYCEFYTYWKDELKDYRKLPDDTATFWNYNGKDCVITWELCTTLKKFLSASNLDSQYLEILRTDRNAITAMLRGIPINQKTQSQMSMQLMDAIAEREILLFEWLGFTLNYGSPKQMAEFFYDDLKVRKVLHKKTRQPTCDADALEVIGTRELLLRPLVLLLNELRSLGVFLSTFIQMPLDSDKRMRCSFNVAGTETYRLSSSENAFGNGGNLQNIPRNHHEE